MAFIPITSGIQWEPKIGDPYPFAWVIVAAYFLAALGCAVCARRADQIFSSKPIRLHRFIWWFMCGVLIFLAVNKQLDLQSLFTQVTRMYARRAGLHDFGKSARKFFVIGLALISVNGIGWTLWKVRRDWRKYLATALGAAFIVRFVVVRAGIFYGVSVPSMSILPRGMKVNPLLELIGALTIAFSAYTNVKSFLKKAPR